MNNLLKSVDMKTQQQLLIGLSILATTVSCSSGGSGTPLGDFSLDGWYRWEWLGLVGGVSGQYCTQIYGDYLFHSVPYTERYNKGSLQPGEFDKLGTSCSHGCIRLQVADAKWIYDNIPYGTKVVTYR